MDVIADLLDSVRARGSVLRQVMQAPPWSVRYTSPPPLTLHVMLRGTSCIISDDAAPIALGSGDVILLRGPDPHTVANAPDTPPQVLIHGTSDCRSPDSSDRTPFRDVPLAPRTYGGTCDAPAVVFTGFYPAVTNRARRLLCALPPVLHLSAADSPRSLLAPITDEITVDQPGQQMVLDRMLDLLLVRTLRTWFARADSGATGWFRAFCDEVVHPALRGMHDRPAASWTVAELAAVCGVSRATFARRFTALVGEPPLTYLTGWRMTLAADLLQEPNTSITEVARQVGYSDAFAFTTAFKRQYGMPPSVYRTRDVERDRHLRGSADQRGFISLSHRVAEGPTGEGSAAP